MRQAQDGCGSTEVPGDGATVSSGEGVGSVAGVAVGAGVGSGLAVADAVAAGEADGEADGVFEGAVAGAVDGDADGAGVGDSRVTALASGVGVVSSAAGDGAALDEAVGRAVDTGAASGATPRIVTICCL